MLESEKGTRLAPERRCPDCDEGAGDPGIVNTPTGFDLCRNRFHGTLVELRPSTPAVERMAA